MTVLQTELATENWRLETGSTNPVADKRPSVRNPVKPRVEIKTPQPPAFQQPR
jgi:hypothetical protein